MQSNHNILKLSQQSDKTWNIEYTLKVINTTYISSGHNNEQEAIDEVNYMMKSQSIIHKVENDFTEKKVA